MTEKILCLDTTSDALSVALWVDGTPYESYEVAPRQQAERILPMLDALLADFSYTLKDLNALAVVAGPGSFTGVRLSVSVAQALAVGADLPVIPISALAALAEQARRVHGAKDVVAAIDARMGELYLAHYTFEDGVWCGTDTIEQPDALPHVSVASVVGVGSGYLKHRQALETAMKPHIIEAYWLPHAKDAVTIAATRYRAGQVLSPAALSPIYLRDQVAAIPKS